MVDTIQHGISFKPGRMEDTCLCHSHRSTQNESKMESVTSTAPLSYRLASLSRRQPRPTSKSYSSACPQSSTTVWNPVYLLTLLLLVLVCFPRDIAAADLQFQSNDGPVSRIRERSSALADSRKPLQHMKKVRRQQDDDDDSPSTTIRAGSAGTQRPTTSTDRPSTQEEPIPLPTGLPNPFDSSVGTNFSNTGCQPFLDNMLNDPELTACEPLSLLLEVSCER